MVNEIGLNMILRLFSLAFLSLLLSSCEKHYVAVTKVDINRSSLASGFAGTPDPRQMFPITGQQLVIEWNLPSTVRRQELFLDLSLVYRDYSEETLRYELTSSRGELSYFLLGENFEEKKGLMTYKADIKTQEGEILKTWQHKLWIKLITLDED